ncbi:glycine cleavage system protein R [Methylomonas sp. MgM2]
MQLAITVLGGKSDGVVAELLSAINVCRCTILDFCASNLTELTSVFVLIDGNWNHLAKLENLLEALRNRFEVQITFLRPTESENVASAGEGVPYTLETISTENKDLLLAVTSFLLERGVLISEINANLHPAVLFSNQIFSTRFTLLVPPDVRILSLREEFLDFCDSMNIDAILEPIKR